MYLDQEKPSLLILSPLIRDSVKPDALLKTDYINSILSTEEVIFNSYLNSSISPIGADLAGGLFPFSNVFNQNDKAHLKLVEDRLMMFLPDDWNEEDKKEWTTNLKRELRNSYSIHTNCFRFIPVRNFGNVTVVTFEAKRIRERKEKLFSLLTYYYEAYSLSSLIGSIFGPRLIAESYNRFA